MDSTQQRARPIAGLIAAIVLLPLLGGALAMWISPPMGVSQSEIGLMLCGYAAVILAFLGGVRWGVEISRRDAPRSAIILFSALPPLIALCGAATAMLLGPRWGFVMVIAAFAILAAWDMRSQALPGWIGWLRTGISVGAVLSMLVAIVGS